MIFIGLGSSIGNAETLFAQTESFLVSKGIKIIKKSSVLKNAPFGGVAKNEFSNAVWQIDFPNTRWEEINWILLPQKRKHWLKACKLLKILHECEDKNGRNRETRWDDRTLDLDILMFHNYTTNRKKISLPHPGISERIFVLKPWLEITNKDFEIPKLGSIGSLLSKLEN